MAALLLAGVIVAALVLLYAHSEWEKKKRIPPGAKPLPGPWGLPLIGRVHDIPSSMSWMKFHAWSQQYGPIYQMSIFGATHVWISDEAIAHELLSRRAATYSDRPRIPNLPDNRRSGEYLALHGHDATWRRERRLCAGLMASAAAGASPALIAYPRLERDRFLSLMARDAAVGETSGRYRERIEEFTSRTVARLAWGTPGPAGALRVTTHGLLETISPSGALPNVVSWLAALPLWLSPWKQRERARHEMERSCWEANLQTVKEGIEDGSAGPSFMRTYLDGRRRGSEEKSGEGGGGESGEREAMYVVGQMAIAGALTIGSPIQSFLLAVLHYPEWLARMQEEIERVCEGARCPEWGDRERMPVLRAVVKEVIRWRPPVPTGIPHTSEKDDVWNGYFIPKGATIHALEWSITRNEQTYPSPETFNPARYLSPAYPTTYKHPLSIHPNLYSHSQFGFGRRTCQGVPIVEQDLFLAMGGLAWAFHIRKRRDPVTGGEVAVHWNEFTPLLIAKPAGFEFEVEVRGEGVNRALRGMWEGVREEGEGGWEDVEGGREAMVGGGKREMMEEDEEEKEEVRSVGGSETSGPSTSDGSSSDGEAVTGYWCPGNGAVHLDIWA